MPEPLLPWQTWKPWLCGCALGPGGRRRWLWRASSSPSSSAPSRTPALLPLWEGLLLLAQPPCSRSGGQAMEELLGRHLGSSWGSWLPLLSLSPDPYKELEEVAGHSTLGQGRDCLAGGSHHPLKKRPGSPQAGARRVPALKLLNKQCFHHLRNSPK